MASLRFWVIRPNSCRCRERILLDPFEDAGRIQTSDIGRGNLPLDRSSLLYEAGLKHQPFHFFHPAFDLFWV